MTNDVNLMQRFSSGKGGGGREIDSFSILVKNIQVCNSNKKMHRILIEQMCYVWVFGAK